MTVINELSDLADSMESMLPRFVKSGSSGYFLRTEDQAVFKRLTVEAKEMLGSALGPTNEYRRALSATILTGYGGFIDGPSYACVSECSQLLRGAINAIKRRALATPEQTVGLRPPYVAPSRIAALRSVPSTQWDLSRLAQLCNELNSAHAHDCHMSVAMLVRAIVDHVPPIFGAENFSAVASNYGGGGRSFTGSMKHLNGSIRNIADSALHTHIRRRESIPTAPQVDFRGDVDVLLGEVLRVVLNPLPPPDKSAAEA